MKLGQKQIGYKIRQGLFFIIKECGNTTFLRLFVCQYFHENLVLFLPQATKSGDDDFILPLSRITSVVCWTHLIFSHMKKNKSVRVLTVPFVYGSLFELLGKSYWFIEAETGHQYQFTWKQNALTWVNDHFDDYRAVWSINNDMPSCKNEIQRSVFKPSFLSCSKTNGEVKPFMTADFLGTFFLKPFMMTRKPWNSLWTGSFFTG